MSKFCTNCGNELNENAAFCIKCGIATNNYTINKTKVKQPGKGLGITSMVLGIIATWYSLCSVFFAIILFMTGEYFLMYEKFIFGTLFLITPITLLIIGLALGFASRHKIKNGINITGLILNFVSLGLCLLSIGLICLL